MNRFSLIIFCFLMMFLLPSCSNAINKDSIQSNPEASNGVNTDPELNRYVNGLQGQPFSMDVDGQLFSGYYDYNIYPLSSTLHYCGLLCTITSTKKYDSITDAGVGFDSISEEYQETFIYGANEEQGVVYQDGSLENGFSFIRVQLTIEDIGYWFSNTQKDARNISICNIYVYPLGTENLEIEYTSSPQHAFFVFHAYPVYLDGISPFQPWFFINKGDLQQHEVGYIIPNCYLTNDYLLVFCFGAGEGDMLSCFCKMGCEEG